MKGQSDTGRWLQSSRKAEYSSEHSRPLSHLLLADLLQFPLIILGSEGRMCFLSNEQKTGSDPFVGDVQNLLTKRLFEAENQKAVQKKFEESLAVIDE